jgi:hypothetical protein
MLTGSLYVADSLSTGVAISGYKNTGYVRSLGYEGYTAGFPGFLMWSGSALSGSLGTKGGVPYSGVGLELYANTSSYFRYSTTDSEIDVRTDKFFFGNPSSSFLSGSNGNIEISASNFHLTSQGNVTASNALFSGVALANIIRDKTVTITAANSSSYITYTPIGVLSPSSGSRIVLDGSLGGEIVRRVRISCSLAYPIQSFVLPQVDNSAKLDIITEFAVKNSLYDIFSTGKTAVPVTPPAAISMSLGSVISLVPAGDTGTRVIVQYGTEMPMDYEFKQDVIVSGSLRSSGNVFISGSTNAINTSWNSYTPVWTAASSNPVIGNGSIEGWYKVIGKTCFVRGNIVMGTTTTFGSGEWYVSMPFTASHADAILMSANLLDNTSAWYNAVVNGARAGFNYKAPLQYQAVSGTANDVNATQPFTWASTDRFLWNGSYEIA